MRIAYLAAGAAGMYCGSCLHDNTLAAALLKLGEDVVLVPIYTPIRTDEPDVSQRRVFFGGINAYLQEKFPVFRHTPRWSDRWLDHPSLLRAVAARGLSVDPTQLGPMTVSMLRGEHGNQRKELARLVDWLLTDIRPDIVHLSNAMMLGLARSTSQRCGPPVVCSLSGEDLFLEKLPAPYYDHAREILRERAGDVDAFVAMNEYYADFMANYLAVPRDRVHVIPHGLDLDGHGGRNPKASGEPMRIGYLARVCWDKGLHLLVDAAELMSMQGQLPAFELHAAGYLGAADRNYLKDIQRRVQRGRLAGRFFYHGELTRAEKIAFLQSLDVFSTPTEYRESKGLPSLEAMANGVPVVLPDHGAFTELIGSTAGGLLHTPRDSRDLARQLTQLLQDPQQAVDLGLNGRHAVWSNYHAERMAGNTLDLYRQLLATTAK